MDSTPLLFLSAAVFIAGTLQAATGIGFGLIGGPALLTQVAASDALITSGLLSAGIAIILIPKLRKQIAWPDLKRLCLGGLAGLPVGAAVFALAGGVALKAGAAMMVLFAFSMLFIPIKNGTGPAPKTGLAVGFISGVLAVGLSMPGPVAAAYMMREGHQKAAVRATILAFFLPSYAAALSLQIFLSREIETDWSIALWLAPGTLAGIVIGQLLSSRLSEHAFRLALQIVLAATIVSLLFSAIGDIAP